jgi:hypothetical protein
MDQRSTDIKKDAKSWWLGRIAEYAGMDAELGICLVLPQSPRFLIFTKSLLPRSELGFVSVDAAV